VGLLGDRGEMQLVVQREVVHVAREVLHFVCSLVVRSLSSQPVLICPRGTYPICTVLVSVILPAMLYPILCDL
jgi:hypothetical protein